MSEFLSDEQKAEQAKTEGTQLREFAKASAAEAAEWKAKFEALESKFKEQALSSIWDGLDVTVPDKVRKHFTGEPTADAVKAWVEENQDVFRFEPKTADGETGDQNDETAQLQAQLEAAQNLGRTKTDLGLAGQLAQLKNSSAKTEADLDSVFSMLPD